MAEALYRKYRPQIFEDVVGQEQIERTIKNAIDQDKVSHAYLFCGPRGTGKTTTARLLAKALLCEKGPTPDPDGTCQDCTMIAEGVHPDVYELDAASRTGVENVREEIINRVQFAPTRGRYKVYIIDEVHMLSMAAFNALLKTLEEPPAHVVFILATTDPQKVPETIHSRCQRFDFRRISNESIVSRLGAVCVAEGVEFEGDALDLIAHHAGGGMRNALTSLEQMIAFGEGKVTLEVAERLLGGVDSSDVSDIMKALGARDGASCFKWIAEYSETGSDLAQFARELAEHVRNLYVMSLTDASVALEVSASERRQLEGELPLFGSERLARMLMVLGDVLAELKTSTNPRLSFEIACTRMVHPEGDLTLAALAERIEALERSGVSAASIVSAQMSPASQPAPSPQRQIPAQAAAAQRQTPKQAAVAQQPVSMPQAAPQSAPSSRLEPSGDSVRTSAQSGSTGTPAPQPAPAVQPVPAAQPAPAPQPATPTGVNSQLAATFANPAALQRTWQAALSSLKRVKAAYGVLFLGTKAVYDAAANMLRIEFPQENAFAFKAVQKSDVQDHVAAALAQACGGQSVPFAFTQAGSAAASVAACTTPVADAARVAPKPASSVAASQPVMREQVVSNSQPATPAPQASAPQAASRQPVPSASRPDASHVSASSRPAAASKTSGRMTPPWEDQQVPYDDATAVSFDEEVDYGSSAPAYQAPRTPSRPSSAQNAALHTGASAPSSAAVPTQQVAQSAPVRKPAQQPSVAQPDKSAHNPVASSMPAAPSSSASQQPVQTPEELQSILQAGFGGGVTFEEVE